MRGRLQWVLAAVFSLALLAATFAGLVWAWIHTGGYPGRLP